MTVRHGCYDPLKRGMDVGVAAIGLLILAPILAITAALVKRKLGSPVLFRQQRPGRGGRTFTLYKFRSMLDVDETKQLITDADRLTNFGQWLRATSLDELPSLFNVLRGDMSLIGPRPLLTSYLTRYTKEQARRHEVRPGITGLAQVNGRNSLSWEEKFKIDVEYVDKRSFLLDLNIVWRSFRAVFDREGINQDGHPTMPEFLGSSYGN